MLLRRGVLDWSLPSEPFSHLFPPAAACVSRSMLPSSYFACDIFVVCLWVSLLGTLTEGNHCGFMTFCIYSTPPTQHNPISKTTVRLISSEEACTGNLDLLF